MMVVHVIHVIQIQEEVVLTFTIIMRDATQPVTVRATQVTQGHIGVNRAPHALQENTKSQILMEMGAWTVYQENTRH